jgi:AraC family transcriptional regulator
LSSKNSLGPGEFYGMVARKAKIAELRLTDVRHPRGRELPRHEHELAYFSLLLDGDYTETIGPRRFRYRPGTVGFHPAGLQHCDEIGSCGGRFFCIELDGRWLQRARDLELRLQPAPAIYEGEVAMLALRLHHEMRSGDDGAHLAAESLILEMLAALGLEPRLFTETGPPAWLLRVKDRLRDEIRPRPALTELALEASVHPVYLARAFRRFERCSIGEYARRLRVEKACRDILRGDRSLADIALDSGFADQAHFTRVFKRFLKVPPGAFRDEA